MVVRNSFIYLFIFDKQRGVSNSGPTADKGSMSGHVCALKSAPHYLLLHLHVFKDGVHPPRLGKHGAESGCVPDDEYPGPDLSEQQAQRRKTAMAISNDLLY